MKFSIKRTVFLVLALSLVAGMSLVTAGPAMGSTPAPQTIILPSGTTTQTAGYTYNNPYYQSVTYVSGTATQTAGYTFTDPSAAKLNAASYGGSWSAASVIANPDGSWAVIGGASWVSTTTANSGVENPNESDAWRLFRASFNIANFSTVTGANIQIAADNAFELYLNGSLIATTATWDPAAPVYGTGPGPSGTTISFEEAATYSLPVQQGANTLMFVVRNWDNSGQGNPSGLVYKVTVRYGVAAQQLNSASYSGAGAWTNASIVTDLASPWVTPVAGAHWVSTTADYSGTDNGNGGDSWRLYRDGFTIPAGATVQSATIQIAADNSFELYLNGSLIDSTDYWSPRATVYGATPEPGGTMFPFEQIYTYTLAPQPGANTLMFVVRNWDNGGENPTALMYQAAITYTVPQASHTITATADSGGSISPSGTVTVNDGADQAFTIAANSGYSISNVTVDGVSQGPVTGYTFHGVSANHNINATFYATSIAGTTGCVTVPANQVNYLIDASAVAQTMVTVSTDGSDSCVRVEHYSGNPHPEAPLPANALNKFNDVLVGDASAVIWPMHVEISYTDAEISALIEPTLRMYYFKGTSWHLCSDTGVNTVDNYVWANMTEDEATGSPIIIDGDPLGGPHTVGGTIFTVNKISLLMPYLALAGALMLVLTAGGLLARRFARVRVKR